MVEISRQRSSLSLARRAGEVLPRAKPKEAARVNRSTSSIKNELATRAARNAARTSPVVINETAAKKLFGSINAIGKHLKDSNHSYEVVGIVHDLKSGMGIKQAIAYVALTRDDFTRPPASSTIAASA